ncbi:MAG: hypothetical protein WD511_01295 [Balneolaceae bacterium]
MVQSTRKRLINRLTRIYQMEGMNAMMFLGVMVILNASYGVQDLLSLSYGILLACFILAQGTYYWWIKLCALEEQNIPVKTVLKRFQKFKIQNKIGILLIPVVFLIQWYISGAQFNESHFVGWAIFTNLFAILEYINYYHRQLMIDNRHDLQYVLQNKKFKEASLFKDMRENKI